MQAFATGQRKQSTFTKMENIQKKTGQAFVVVDKKLTPAELQLDKASFAPSTQRTAPNTRTRTQART
jgi:hypothetical protein